MLWSRGAWSLILLGAAGITSGAEPIVRLEVEGRTLEGLLLAASEQRAWLLTRDGQLAPFSPKQAQRYAALPDPFRALSQAEIRGLLLREFGQGFEVSGVGHYIVVHPAGTRDRWAMRFEELYRAFVHYFAARGWELRPPTFPLIAVVYPRQSDFWRYAQQEGFSPASGILGYYSPLTNRIVMYDATNLGGQDWSVNAETIIHEATHQSAFNTGVHTRFGQVPRWVVEGLGTLFEARGVWQSHRWPSQGDRIQRSRLAAWRAWSSTRRPPDALAQLVSSDRWFTEDPGRAYAEAWAVTFFLSETMPDKYVAYLQKTAKLPGFTEYPAPQRLADFVAVFGSDLRMLDARLKRFLDGLK
jgi:hypothetical protein